jgi:hypothetical protein
VANAGVRGKEFAGEDFKLTICIERLKDHA